MRTLAPARCLPLIACLALAGCTGKKSGPPPPSRPADPEGHSSHTLIFVRSEIVLVAVEGPFDPSPQVYAAYVETGEPFHGVSAKHLTDGKPLPGASKEYLAYYKDSLKDVQKGDTIEVTCTTNKGDTGYSKWSVKIVQGIRIVKRAEPFVKVDLRGLLAECEKDPRATKVKYLYKTVEVTGYIAQVELDTAAKPFLRQSPDYKKGEPYMLVYFTLPDPNSKLRKSNHIKGARVRLRVSLDEPPNRQLHANAVDVPAP